MKEGAGQDIETPNPPLDPPRNKGHTFGRGVDIESVLVSGQWQTLSER
jgi:hypothetical protein